MANYHHSKVKTAGTVLRRSLCLSVLFALSAPLSLEAESAGKRDATHSTLNVLQTPQRSVEGTVVDAKTGEPIIGATVIVKGASNRGATTNIDGVFRLSVAKGEVLRISYIGYKAQDIVVGEQAQLRIALVEDQTMLEETVVVGYATQKKINLSGSVASVDSKKLEARPIQNLSGGLQGMVPGLTISGTNGAPGMDGGSIRVRGTGTLNNANPYILIDGIEAGTINAVDPNDIASISVLKDAASAAIYGSKAANGVILITTKRGKSGATRVSYSGYFSAQNATHLVERMPSYEYAELLNKIDQGADKAARFAPDVIQKMRDGSDPDNYGNTDWYGLAYKTGLQHRHSVSVSGGNDHAKYMASIGYLNQTGILPNADRQQYNARTNLDLTFSKKFTAQLGLAYIKNDYNDPSSAYYGGSSDQLIRQLNIISPWIVARKSDGSYGTIGDGNPIAWLDHGLKVGRKNTNFTGNASLSYEPIAGLKFTAKASHVRNVQHYTYFQDYFRYNPSKTTDPNFLKKQVADWNLSSFDFLINYDKSFGLHNLKVLAGYHAEAYDSEYLYGERQNFPNNDMTDMNAGEVATQKNQGNTRELNLLSYFGRINYDYDGKYLLEANLRVDASSRFARGYRWGYFPSFSAAWRISREAFMRDIDWLSDLKIRASWGMLGNQSALDYYPAITTYGVGYSYPFGGTLAAGYGQSKINMEDISWEKTTSTGVGLDFGFWGQNLTGSIDLYRRHTRDILMNVSVPAEFQLGDYTDNVGEMENKGVELSLNYRTSLGQVNLGFSGNLAYNRNKILNLGGVDVIGSGDVRNAVGQPIGAHYVYKTNGFFQSQAEADEYTKLYGNPFGRKFMAGDLRYVDLVNDIDKSTGKEKVALTGADRIYMPSSEPAWTFGFGLTAEYKGFDFAATFNGVAEAYRIFSAEVYGRFAGDNGHPATVWRQAWSEENKGGTMPRLFLNDDSPSSVARVSSDFWLQDISYLRLKNLQLGYTLPKSWLGNVGISSVRIYYSAENLLTFDKMRVNADPEATSGRLSSYPLLRTHALGLNVTF